MVKADLIREVGIRADATQEDSKIFIDAFIETIKDAVKDGDSVLISGFGTFEGRKRKEHRVTHPTDNNKEIIVPAYIAPAFKPSPIFKDYINNG